MAAQYRFDPAYNAVDEEKHLPSCSPRCSAVRSSSRIARRHRRPMRKSYPSGLQADVSVDEYVSYSSTDPVLRLQTFL
jgi:hypothetical protein